MGTDFLPEFLQRDVVKQQLTFQICCNMVFTAQGFVNLDF
jgi:hypothetical protein